MAHAAAETNVSVLQYFRLLLDYRDIRICPIERTAVCALMTTYYFVVVVLPSRQSKRVARLTACNYETDVNAVRVLFRTAAAVPRVVFAEQSVARRLSERQQAAGAAAADLRHQRRLSQRVRRALPGDGRL